MKGSPFMRMALAVRRIILMTAVRAHSFDLPSRTFLSWKSWKRLRFLALTAALAARCRTRRASGDPAFEMPHFFLDSVHTIEIF